MTNTEVTQPDRRQKLTPPLVAKIRAALDRGEPQREIADRLGVSQPTVSRVKNWRQPRGARDPLASLQEMADIDLMWESLRARVAARLPHLSDAAVDEATQGLVALRVAALRS